MFDPTHYQQSYPQFRHDNMYYELPVVKGSATNFLGGANTGDTGAFYAEVSSLQDSLKTFDSNVARIDDLHSQSLSTDDVVSQRSAALSAELVEETSAQSVLSATLKRRIQTLESQPSSGRDAQVRIQQLALIKSKFLDMIQNYKQMEERYRQKHKLRIERLFKNVKPDANPKEIRTVVNDSGGQIFSQALMDSDFQGDSRAACREVQARHQDIQRIERTIIELAQLFNDMSIMVYQSEVRGDSETTSLTVERDLEAELARANMTIALARVTKKRLWICIAILVVIIIAIVVLIVVSAVEASRTP